mmetsp:Transcript_73862/g.187306  ORF Transcript_73862/g.187306 Transcript_73862/m.187306 type:complete len:207 (-) Transcript_73862:213-833(-)
MHRDGIRQGFVLAPDELFVVALAVEVPHNRHRSVQRDGIVPPTLRSHDGLALFDHTDVGGGLRVVGPLLLNVRVQRIDPRPIQKSLVAFKRVQVLPSGRRVANEELSTAHLRQPSMGAAVVVVEPSYGALGGHEELRQLPILVVDEFPPLLLGRRLVAPREARQKALPQLLVLRDEVAASVVEEGGVDDVLAQPRELLEGWPAVQI